MKQPLSILSWNVNGLRSIYRNGGHTWLKESKADIICLQELKLQEKDFGVLSIKDCGYFNYADKKGYSGVAVFTEEKAYRCQTVFGLERFDQEGRFIELSFPGFTLINLYLPHGGRDKENLAYKLDVYKRLLNHLKKIKDKNVILIGDFNIAHQEIDLARPKQNKNNIMFTPEERAQIDKLLKFGVVDTFRMFHKDGGHYTWWPYFANARNRNLGWRIDYCFVSRSLAPVVKNAFILKDVRGSDHCPIGIKLAI